MPLLQLIGKLKANHTLAVFDVEGANILPENGLTVELVNIFFCEDPVHTAHFPERATEDYPVGADAYNETVERRVPIPRRVSRRRSTIFFRPNLEQEIDVPAPAHSDDSETDAGSEAGEEDQQPEGAVGGVDPTEGGEEEGEEGDIYGPDIWEDALGVL